MSLSQNQLKLITSLQRKKYRVMHNLFLVEGKKAVAEFLNSDFELHGLYCLHIEDYDTVDQVCEVSTKELKKISSLKSPNNVVGVFKIKTPEKPVQSGFTLVLDGISDPGNLGTIIRLCDWFGVSQIVCSTDTVDCYNPKVVQASMGSLARVAISYTNIEKFLSTATLPVYATGMSGDAIYETEFPKECILIMGNEANGVRQRVFDLASSVVTIPKFGLSNQTESLNVGTATAVLLSEYRRANQ